jgi:hypothetical protein
MAYTHDAVWLYPVFTLNEMPDIHYNDRFNKTTYDGDLTVRAYVMSVPDIGCHMMFVGSPEFDKPELGIMAVGSEKSLLERLWENLSGFVVGRMLCGWRMTDHSWPKLINRSLANGIGMPIWARNDLTKRYNTVNLLDAANIYRQGIYEGARPVPSLSKCIKLWTGRDLPEEVEISAKMNAGNWEFVWDNVCQYLTLMDDVKNRYNGFIINKGA